jgi:aminoglycoside 6-adenylyltransferase
VAASDLDSGTDRAEEYLVQFVERCREERSVQGVLLLGSAAAPRAREALSDIDLMIITTSPRRLASLGLLQSIEPLALFSWNYGSPVGGQLVGQAIYDGPLVVDLAFVSSIQAFLLGIGLSVLRRRPTLRRRLPTGAMSQFEAWLAITARGARVLFDRAGLAKRIAVDREQPTPRVPTNEVFLNTVHSALGLALWESKQLVRGEVWMAVETVDTQLKHCLLTMIEWHARAVGAEPGATWYGGRHIEDWADQRWLPSLRDAWPRYDVSEAWDALTATCMLFSEVAVETARLLGYHYPKEDEVRIWNWIEARRANAQRDPSA